MDSGCHSAIDETKEHRIDHISFSRWFRVSFLMVLMSAFLSVAAFASEERPEGFGGSRSIAEVTSSFSTLTDMVGQVFNAIVSNPVLVVFLAAALLRVGIGLFRSLRRAAR